MKILVVNEYENASSPVSRLVCDYLAYHNKLSPNSSYALSISGDYVPGGYRLRRILNMIIIHLLLPFYMIFLKMKLFLSKDKLVVLCTTSPPLAYWSAIFFGKIFNIQVIVWYQDAIPRIISKKFENFGLFFISKFLVRVDSFFLKYSSGLVALDNAMIDCALSQNKNDFNWCISPPWATYMNPAKPFRSYDFHSNVLKLIYAGNYGESHDISPLAQEITNLKKHIKNINIHLTVVTSDSRTIDAFQLAFKNIVDLSFVSRFPNIKDLCLLMDSFDFGIVSLKYDLNGVSCPSKVYTYLSQGLPVLYVGPEETLAHTLVSQGWGIWYKDLINYFENQDIASYRNTSIFQDPSIESKKIIYNFILNSCRFSLKSQSHREPV